MKLTKIEPFKTIRALYYANRPIRYRNSGIKIINGINYQPIAEPPFSEKLKNTVILIKESILKKKV